MTFVMPRYAQIGKVIDNLFILRDKDGHNFLILKKKINTNIIVKEWETIQRIVVSLKNNTIGDCEKIIELQLKPFITSSVNRT